MSAYIQGLEYKIGVHGKVYWLNGDEWHLSTLPIEKYWYNIRFKLLKEALSMLKTRPIPIDQFAAIYPDDADEIIKQLLSKKLITKRKGLNDVYFLSVPKKVRREDSEFTLKRLAKGWSK